MKAKQINFGGILLYILSGLSAVILAFWLSSQLIGKAFSQINNTDQKALPILQSAQAPENSALPPNTAKPLQTTGSQILTILPSSKKEPSVDSNPENKIPELLVGIIEDYDYTAVGKRDPFTPFERASNNAPLGPVWPLQKYDLEQLKLVGVIWEVKTPKAMILDPSGHGYVVTVNERIGRNNGYIARIREGEIVVVENMIGIDGKATYVTKLMKLHPQ